MSRRTGPSFADFVTIAAAAGLDANDYGNGHWQLRGGTVLVNYYPFGRRGPTIYVNGTRDSDESGTPERAVQVALEGPKVRGWQPDRRGSGWRRREKLRLLRIDPLCHWCRTPIDYDTSTIDHQIPRARGGADTRDNLVLACPPCNHGRGHRMAAP